MDLSIALPLTFVYDLRQVTLHFSVALFPILPSRRAEIVSHNLYNKAWNNGAMVSVVLCYYSIINLKHSKIMSRDSKKSGNWLKTTIYNNNNDYDSPFWFMFSRH